MSTETQEKQPSQEAIDFLFTAKMSGKITEGIQTNHEVQMIITELFAQQEEDKKKLDDLRDKIEDLSNEIDQLKDDLNEANNSTNGWARKYDDVKEELDEYNEGRVLKDDTVNDTLKNKILIRMGNQLTLEQVEVTENVVSQTFPNYNLHI